MITESPEYLTRQLITYIGNKRGLLSFIGQSVDQVKKRTGKNRLRIFDAFSGSGVVSRYLKSHAETLVSNDLEDYAATVARCYLRNRGEVDWNGLTTLVAEMNHRVASDRLPSGFIERLYAPRDEQNITLQDRAFYTLENARRLDHYRQLIEEAPAEYRDLLLGPLLSSASIHANTAGVFKGFYKNRTTGVGQFGGSGKNAISRITGEITLRAAVLSRYDCESIVTQEDANIVARRIKKIDLAYIDPPYNQHPYGSNYFMLNLIAGYEEPEEVSRVSGIPKQWQRSGYNVRDQSLPLLVDLLENLDARFLLISFNDEGYIPPSQMLATLQRFGQVDTIEIKHNTFRGSRNLSRRQIHVVEQLFLVEKY